MFNLSEEEKERAEHLHKESIVVDTLADGPTVFSQDMLKRLDELIGKILQHQLSWMKWTA